MKTLLMMMVVVVVGLAAPTARADGLDGGAVGFGDAPAAAPCVAPPAAPIVQRDVPLPDGGVEDRPVAMHTGQPVPTDGVFLTTLEFAKRTGERDGLRLRTSLLETEIERAKPIPGWIWLVTCGATVVTGAYCAGHDCNPFHLGRK